MIKTKIYDRFQQVIETGDLVHICDKGDVVWRVESTAPVLHPQAPPGLVELRMVAIVVQGLPGGTAIPALLRCVDASALEPEEEGILGPRAVPES